MSAAQHTPGPWVASFTHLSEVRATNGAVIAKCQKLNGLVTLQANARLIAAAPEMLEALEMVRDADDDCKRDGLPTIPLAARAKIDAAIEKATGSAA